MQLRESYIDRKRALFPDGRSKSSLYKFTSNSCKTFDDSNPIWATKQVFFFDKNAKALTLVSEKMKMQLHTSQNYAPLTKMRSFREPEKPIYSSFTVSQSRKGTKPMFSQRESQSHRLEINLNGELLASNRKVKYNLPIHIKTIYNRYKKGCHLTKVIQPYNTIDLPSRTTRQNFLPNTTKYKSQAVTTAMVSKKRSELFHNQMLKKMLETTEKCIT